MASYQHADRIRQRIHVLELLASFQGLALYHLNNLTRFQLNSWVAGAWKRSLVNDSRVGEVVEFEVLEAEARFKDGAAVFFAAKFDGGYVW